MFFISLFVWPYPPWRNYHQSYVVVAFRRVPTYLNETVYDIFGGDELSTTEDRRNLKSFISTSTTKYIVPTDPESHRVMNLPGLDPSPDLRHYSGHLTVREDVNNVDGRAELFYWLIEPEDRSKSESLPLLVWLNGGPGCSSMDGLHAMLIAR